MFPLLTVAYVGQTSLCDTQRNMTLDASYRTRPSHSSWHISQENRPCEVTALWRRARKLERKKSSITLFVHRLGSLVVRGEKLLQTCFSSRRKFSEFCWVVYYYAQILLARLLKETKV